MRLQDQRPLTVVKTGKERGNFKARRWSFCSLSVLWSVFPFPKYVFGEITRGTSHFLEAVCDGIFLPGNS